MNTAIVVATNDAELLAWLERRLKKGVLLPKPPADGKSNALANWTWGANALALIVAGVISDRLRVRKPLMLAGGIGGAVMLWAICCRPGSIHHSQRWW